MKKELLQKKKVGLNKLLENRADFLSGLCHLIAVLYKRNVLTYEESDLLNELIDSYFENSEKARKAFRMYQGFMWEPGNWKKREKWILHNLETIDLLLNSTK